MTQLKTTNIHGKEYVEVNERIKAFRTSANYIGYSLDTEIVELTPDFCTMRAVVKDKDGRVIASGLAHEEKNASNINRTSYIENCETSAWGRALGNLGIGVDSAICSAFELMNALAAQGEKENKVEQSTKPTAKSSQMAKKEPKKEDAKQTLTQEQADYIANCIEFYKKPENANAADIAKKTIGKPTNEWTFEDYNTAAQAVNDALYKDNK